MDYKNFLSMGFVALLESRPPLVNIEDVEIEIFLQNVIKFWELHYAGKQLKFSIVSMSEHFHYPWDEKTHKEWK